MASHTLEQIVVAASQLSLDEQLDLMEQLARQIRRRSVPPEMSLDDTLRTMAEDPDIQREIAAINAEFAHTEADGLSAAL